MPVRATSKAALRSIRESGKQSTKKGQMYLFIVHNPGCSRNDIERHGFRQSSVAGRVNELISEGFVIEDGCKRDPITRESVNCLYPAPEKGMAA
ncbi:MarR family transcriptional regulator [Pseudomaricurvus alkylphenolicus]|uniref:MarR family transcriptional regulator n=1 Tax=Pseudomaricurvus alkylphenolicus TaxID=1306991 RepID=UPI001424099A|nr:MarR family transcriptional regulator [Pseudomaricurvus alkylphenolicus]NIB43780.1 MarR family transcriptional regulator [Pseudomaricurvus alkylphenolicus]